MSKRKLPSTSHEANKKATLEMRQGHYKKIMDALSQLGTANYEAIANHVGLERHAVGRRVSEMEGLQLIYKPGTQSKTKSGRMAMNYCLTGQGMPIVEPKFPDQIKSLSKSVAESNELLSSFTPTERGIQDLFKDGKQKSSQEPLFKI